MANTSRFGGKLYLVLLEARDRSSLRSGRALWGIQSPLTYQAGANKAEIITVPAGFVTDLASIPRLVWSFYPPDGPWVKGAVIHDFLYFTQGTGKGQWKAAHGITRTRPYSRAEADHIFYEAMTDRGIGTWAKFVIWAAVRLGGWIGWAHKHTKPRPHPTPATLRPAPKAPTKAAKGP